MSEGPILWIYSAEVCHDAAFGLATFGQFLNLFFISMATEYMVASLDTSGTFFVFSACSFVGGIFIYLFVKESTGLTDKEKKNLYTKINKVNI